MLPFTHAKPSTSEDAVSLVLGSDRGQATRARTQFVAGGTNMTDYMKLGVARPGQLVDLNGLEDGAFRQIKVSPSEIRLGALVHMSEVEDHPEIQKLLPVLTDSLRLAASRQIRNMATIGGNILQRTRCEYFRETSWPCNKRNPGSGCAALEGFNRQHAVLGGSSSCIATYHGDLAQALVALDATVEVHGARGRRRLAFADLHRLPGETPEIETTIRADEIITSLTFPIAPWMARSTYLKIRDRQSYAFALASAAVVLDLDGTIVREARIALGGLATVPWRAREAEAELQGKPLDEETCARAAKVAFADATPRKDNGFKIALGRQTLVRALLETRDMRI
ncbi:xanthine dehydrogenase family protein subunit M (plasmid) [Ensifer adhaerens]|uniref:FAD binding domain-containing protein n=1 Tax=Ensifer adhaerens TaxID=106592 RepID=UPI001CBD434E|nr:xanthine dehydrogenase family protein subunit M [Ensifer adhaerens]MBZ7927503.1 xanthine dehydrogenase family protein subunit M [Ensifer adhaerens]UAX97925.1 xanthine dehydrogenase family protein subunit M [Ensifer adhaerens]UAY05304.1 xanthine dehydrogenase family protein subunit M [Ensifer adhaerens]UAY12682.1 xanthine dehydrogenase family protein subunit M [Ensifer adhaerens]